MIPVRDDQPRFSTPYVTYFLIALNPLIFLFESALTPQSFKTLLYQFGMISADVTGYFSGTGDLSLVAVLLPALTSMFLHGSWMHVIGNLWFLWIFGDNIEDYLGHFPYLIFYLLCGFAAAFTDIAISPASRLPTIGASGAIAGVLGAYILLYPRARVLTLVVLIIFFTFWWLPAWVFLGYWFLIQFVASSVAASGAHQTGGVAFAAHVGGFIAGLVLIKVFRQRTRSYRYGS